MTDARRAGRVAFGLVLIAGAAVLATSTLHGAGHSAEILGITWLAAFAAAGIVYLTYRGDVALTTSLVVPACGVALVVPLSLHLLFFAFVSQSVRGFDEWVTLSLIATAIAHVMFAVMAMARAYRLARGESALSIVSIYWACVTAGAVPFVIPAMYVAITGLPIVPLLAYMRRLAERERAAPELPRAVVV